MATFNGISTLDQLNAVELNGSAIEYGLDRINVEVNKTLQMYNKQVDELLSAEICENLTEQVKVFNTGEIGEGIEGNEFSRGMTMNTNGIWQVGFILKKYLFNVGYTFDWLQIASVGEVSRKLIELQGMHQKNTRKQIMKALFTLNTNDTSRDEFDNGEEVTVRGFWNADSSNMPANAAGKTFDGSSHSHYLGSVSGSVAASDINGLINTIVEHDVTEGLFLAINPEDTSTIEAFTSNFTPLASPVMNYNVTDVTKLTQTSDDMNNRQIGFWNRWIPVWTKPYVPQHYMTCLSTGNSMGKPIGRRLHKVSAMRGLRLNSTSLMEPLITERAISFEGYGILNRSAGGVLLMNNSSYSAPTL